MGLMKSSKQRKGLAAESISGLPSSVAGGRIRGYDQRLLFTAVGAISIYLFKERSDSKELLNSYASGSFFMNVHTPESQMFCRFSVVSEYSHVKKYRQSHREHRCQ